MLFQPLALEALALRQVIQERGIMNLPSGLVPRMRQELEELARLPGVYEIVEIQINTHKEDKEVEDQAYRKNVKIGDRIKVSCPRGQAWTLEVAGLPSKKFSLDRETFREPDGYTISRNGFVEDGNVKCHSWRQLDKGGGKNPFFYSGLEYVHLDPRGCLLWKYQLQTWNETLTATVWTKRIYIKEPARFEPFQVLIYTLTYVRDAIKSIGHFE